MDLQDKAAARCGIVEGVPCTGAVHRRISSAGHMQKGSVGDLSEPSQGPQMSAQIHRVSG